MSIRFGLILAPVFVALTAVTAPSPAMGSTRYTAVFEDGSVVRDTQPLRWDDGRRLPILGNRALLDEKNPVRSLRREGGVSGLRPPYVVFRCGDVLAGRVVGYEPGPPMRPRDGTVRLRVTRDGKDTDLPVRSSHVAQVVWDQAAGDDIGAAARVEPQQQVGRAVLADGRQVPTEAVRWEPEGVALLTESGVERFGFGSLDLLQLPGDGGGAVETGAALRRDAQAGRGVIATVHLSDGSLLSYAPDQIVASKHRHGKHHRVVHAVQPPWARQPVSYRLEKAAAWSFRRANELPLGVLPVTAVHQGGAVLGASVMRDRSSSGGSLASNGVGAAQGLFMRAHSSVVFQLPEGAQSVRGWVGIESSVGNGGCAIASVYLSEKDRRRRKPAWSSKHLLGGRDPVRFGPIRTNKSKEFVLAVADGHKGRPKGADPFDIRDEMAWLQPVVTMDPAAWGGMPPLGDAWPGADAWTLDDDSRKRLRLGRAFNTTTKRWHRTLHTDKQGVTLRRSLTLGKQPFTLDLSLASNRSHRDHTVTVQVIEQGQAEDATPEPVKVSLRQQKGRAHDVRHVTDLEPFAGKKIELIIRITQNADQAARNTPGLQVHRMNLLPKPQPKDKDKR